jgi:hypothetical protein
MEPRQHNLSESSFAVQASKPAIPRLQAWTPAPQLHRLFMRAADAVGACWQLTTLPL